MFRFVKTLMLIKP